MYKSRMRRGGVKSPSLKLNKLTGMGKNKVKRRKGLVLLLLITGAAIGVLFTPVFNVRYITVSGNEKISTEKITELSKINTGVNILSVNINNALSTIGGQPYINTVTIKRVFPSTVDIRVTECKPVAYIKSGIMNILIDKNGKLLEGITEGDIKLPVLTGVSPQSFTIGEIFSQKDDENFKIMLETAEQIYHNSIVQRVKAIKAENNEIVLTMGDKLEGHLGTNDKLAYKVRFMTEILKNIPEDSEGIIDLKSGEKGIFKPNSY